MGMGSERIVEAIDVGKKTLFQLVERLIKTSVDFFLRYIYFCIQTKNGVAPLTRDLRKICVKDKRRQYNRLTTGRE